MRNERGVVIVNTTPIISLALLGQLNLLQKLYGKVFIPKAVHDELLAGKISQPGSVEVTDADYIKTVLLTDTGRAELLSDLDRGEAEVIALAQELHANLVIIDERMGRKHAKRLGFSITGVLGVLLKAKERGLILEIKPLVKILKDGGIYLGDDIIFEILRLANER